LMLIMHISHKMEYTQYCDIKNPSSFVSKILIFLGNFFARFNSEELASPIFALFFHNTWLRSCDFSKSEDLLFQNPDARHKFFTTLKHFSLPKFSNI